MREYLSGQQPIPDYRLIERVGKGSYGEVWKAEGPGGVLVALKIISKIDGIDAIREWQSLQDVKNVNHANLVDIYGVWLRDEEDRVLSDSEINSLIPAEVGHQQPPHAALPRPASDADRVGWTGRPRAGPSSAAANSMTISPDAESAVFKSLAELAVSEDVLSPAPSTARNAAGSTGANPAVSGSVQSGSGSAQSGSASGSGSQSRWGKLRGKVQPLELITAMTLGDGTLMDRLNECKSAENAGIPRDELLRYMRDAAAGLKCLNDREILHCDVKPENLLLVGGSVKVCDYGSALKAVYTADSHGFKGCTPQYAAPEQLVNRKLHKSKLHQTTDMYALAVTYYALRTHKFPWSDLTKPQEIPGVKAAENFDFAALQQKLRFPFELDVVRRALKRNPKERPESVSSFVEELENAVEKEAKKIDDDRRRRLRNWSLAGATALILCVAGLAWHYGLGLGPGRTSRDEFNGLVRGDTLEDLERAIQQANNDEALKSTPEEADETAKGLRDLLAKVAAREPASLDQAIGLALDIRDDYHTVDLRNWVLEKYPTSSSHSINLELDDKQFQKTLKAIKGDDRLATWQIVRTLTDQIFETWKKVAINRMGTDPPRENPKEDVVQSWAASWAAMADSFPDREVANSLFEHLQKWSDSANVALNNAQRDSHGLGQSAAACYAARQCAAVFLEKHPAAVRDSLLVDWQAAEIAAGYENNQDRNWLERQLAEQKPDLSAASPQSKAVFELFSSLAKPNEAALLTTVNINQLGELAGHLKPDSWQHRLASLVWERIDGAALPRRLNGTLPSDVANALLKATTSPERLLGWCRIALVAYNANPNEGLLAEAEGTLEKLQALPNPEPLLQSKRQALNAWHKFLTPGSKASETVPSCLAEFQSLEQDADEWFRNFGDAVVARCRSWDRTELTAVIVQLASAADMTSAATANLAQSIRQLAIRLCEQRVYQVATGLNVNDADFEMITSECEDILKHREGSSAEVIWPGSFLPVPVLRALLAESVIQSAADGDISKRNEAQSRAAEVLGDASLDSTKDLDQQSYVQFVKALIRANAKSKPSKPAELGWNPNSSSDWLRPPFRRALAARSLDRIAGSLPLPRGRAAIEPGRFDQYLHWIEEAARWPANGTPEKAECDANLAIALKHSSRAPDWNQILRLSNSALSHPKTPSLLDKQAYCHLLLAHATATQGLHGHGGDHSTVISAFARLLNQATDPYGASPFFDDSFVFKQMLQPVLPLIDQAPADLSAPIKADLATIYGALGAILERDMWRSIAIDHYGFAKDPEQFFNAMENAFTTATEYELQPALRIRWLAGQLFALDQRSEMREERDPELDLIAEHSALRARLTHIASEISRIDGYNFLIAFIEGLNQFYEANDRGDPKMVQKDYEKAIARFFAAAKSLTTDAKSKTEWGQSWNAALAQTMSVASLNASWGLPKGTPHQKLLQDAISHAEAALRVPLHLRADPSRAYLARANAYEDYGANMDCTVFYEEADRSLAELLPSELHSRVDDFRKARLEAARLRIQFRRMLISQQRTDDELSNLIGEMEVVVRQMRRLQYEAAARDLEYYIGEVHFNGASVKHLEEAAVIFNRLAAQSNGQRTTGYLYYAAEAEWSKALALSNDSRPESKAASSRAANEADTHLSQIGGLLQADCNERMRRKIAKLRATVRGGPKGTADKATADIVFAALHKEVQAVLDALPNQTAEGDTNTIEWLLLLAEQPCSSEAHLLLRRRAIDDCKKLLQAHEPRLQPAQYLEFRIRLLSESGFCGGALATLRETAKQPFRPLVNEAIDELFEVIADGGRLEKVAPEWSCCAQADGPALGAPIRLYKSALVTLRARRWLAHLSSYIADDPNAANPAKLARLLKIDEYLAESSRELPANRETEKSELQNLRQAVNRLLPAKGNPKGNPMGNGVKRNGGK